jgi:hypothetical protein
MGQLAGRDTAANRSHGPGQRRRRGARRRGRRHVGDADERHSERQRGPGDLGPEPHRLRCRAGPDAGPDDGHAESHRRRRGARFERRRGHRGEHRLDGRRARRVPTPLPIASGTVPVAP